MTLASAQLKSLDPPRRKHGEHGIPRSEQRQTVLQPSTHSLAFSRMARSARHHFVDRVDALARMLHPVVLYRGWCGVGDLRQVWPIRSGDCCECAQRVMGVEPQKMHLLNQEHQSRRYKKQISTPIIVAAINQGSSFPSASCPGHVVPFSI